MMPVLPCSLALRMSAVVFTGITRSLFSRIRVWLATMLLIVAWKPSHTDTVQLAAVRPPLRMSSNSARFHLAMISPSITMLSACNSAGLIRRPLIGDSCAESSAGALGPAYAQGPTEPGAKTTGELPKASIRDKACEDRPHGRLFFVLRLSQNC